MELFEVVAWVSPAAVLGGGCGGSVTGGPLAISVPGAGLVEGNALCSPSSALSRWYNPHHHAIGSCVRVLGVDEGLGGFPGRMQSSPWSRRECQQSRKVSENTKRVNPKCWKIVKIVWKNVKSVT